MTRGRGEPVNLAQLVRFKLWCGAVVTLRVSVDRRPCTCGRRDCPTAADVAGVIWLQLQEQDARAPSSE